MSRKKIDIFRKKGLQLDHGGLRAVPETASGEQLWVRAGRSRPSYSAGLEYFVLVFTGLEYFITVQLIWYTLRLFCPLNHLNYGDEIFFF